MKTHQPVTFSRMSSPVSGWLSPLTKSVYNRLACLLLSLMLMVSSSLFPAFSALAAPPAQSTVTAAGQDAVTALLAGAEMVDVALIIDSSGSMFDNDRTNKRLEAARVYLTASAANDRVAIVDFDDNVNLASGLRPVRVNNQPNPQLISAINTIDASGATNIRDGITAACNELINNGAATKRGAILLTDGDHNVGDFGSPQTCFASRGWPIYTFGFGSADATRLTTIATQTGGQYKNISNVGSLLCEFQRIRALIAGAAPQNCTTLSVSQGQTVTLAAAVPPSQAQTTFSTSWAQGSITMSLRAPNGRVIDRNTNAPDVTRDAGATFEVYTITTPQSGNWQVNLFGASVPAGGQQVFLGFTNIPAPSSALDNFNRTNGKLGSNWFGTQGINGYTIANGQVDVAKGGPVYWSPSIFGSDQAVSLRLVNVDPKGGRHGLLMKVQGQWDKGTILITHNGKEREIGIRAYIPGRGWNNLAVLGNVLLRNGDVLGGTVAGDGTTRALVNGQEVLRANVGSFFTGKGGRIGLWFNKTPNALFDDFTGGGLLVAATSEVVDEGSATDELVDDLGLSALEGESEEGETGEEETEEATGSEVRPVFLPLIIN